MNYQNVSRRIVYKGVERFANGKKINASYNGSVFNLNGLPEDIHSLFNDDMLTHSDKAKCHFKMGLSDLYEILYRFAWCMYRGYDKNPNLNASKVYLTFW